MQFKIIFSRHDLFKATGINYIYDNYLKIFKNNKDFHISSSFKLNLLDKTPSGIFLILYSLMLPLLFLPCLLIKIFMHRKSAEKLFLVGHMHNLRNLALNLSMNVCGMYCVDSLYNYHRLRFSHRPFFIRQILLFPAYIIEVFYVLITDSPLYFNSNKVTDEFKKRYKFILNKNREIKCLNIGSPKINIINNLQNTTNINKLAIYGNFLFYESRKGLDILIDSLHQINKQSDIIHTNIYIFGKNSLEFYSEFNGVRANGVHFFVLGMVDSVKDTLQNFDGVIIPVDETGGLKIKLLESLSYGLHVVTTNNVAIHLENYKSYNNLQTFSSISNIAKNLSSISMKNDTDISSVQNLPSWNVHLGLIERLFYEK
jgi:glycosyltransferase involved in cell wall biosynthesis